MPGRTATGRRGFTLIEAMSATLVLSALGSITSFLILDAVDGYTEAATYAQLHSELSISLDRAGREVRKIELDAGAAGVAPDIDDVQADSIQWTDSGDDAYLLRLTGTNLELQVNGGPIAVLVGDVTAFVVTIFDEDDAAVAIPAVGVACDDIRRVRLQLTTSRNGLSETLQTKIFLRSTMDGAQ